jgi:DNA-binding CsgD family transcriptional regulator
MARASTQPRWSKLLESWLARPGADLVPTAVRHSRIIHSGVIAASLLGLAANLPVSDVTLITWVIILLGFALLRTLTAGRVLTSSTFVLEPIGVAVFLAGTGGQSSPFMALAPAGIWWVAVAGSPPQEEETGKASAGRGWQRGLLDAIPLPSADRRVAVYVAVLVATYLTLVLPVANREGAGTVVIQNVVLLIAFGLMTLAWGRARDSWRRGQLMIPALGAEELAIREGLERALRTIDIPIDAVLSAGRMGLTANQAELLAYLMLGLSNQEIADATDVSEATVRYRLTRLYRVLEVSGRKQAAARARELGLTAKPLPAARRAP